MDVGRARSQNNWRARGRGNARGQWRGRANVADAGQRSAFNCFSCGEEGHYARNCPQQKGRGAKANLIDFDPKEETAYEGSQAEGSRVALVKTEMDTMSFDERQELIKELAGEEGKDFHSA
jgi:hypothetical protein